MSEIITPKEKPIEIKGENGNERGCPMLNALMPVMNPLTKQPQGIKMQLYPCAGKMCAFWKDEYNMCGILMMIEAVMSVDENEPPKEEPPQEVKQ